MTVLAVKQGELERNGKKAIPSLVSAKPSDDEGCKLGTLTIG
jgi:hypothetical protein